MDIAIAFFVKTPGISPLKTRLAAGTSTPFSLEFHKRSALACKSVVASFDRAQAYWAIAEKEGLDHELWRDEHQIFQGEGSLGDRLHKVYSELLSKHKYVFLMGADCPQFSLKELHAAYDSLESGVDFYFGPAKDGGFYLFGSKSIIPKEVWLETPYSKSNTRAELSDRLEKLGKVSEGKHFSDVDRVEDLKTLLNEFQGSENLSLEQMELIEYIKNYIKD